MGETNSLIKKMKTVFTHLDKEIIAKLRFSYLSQARVCCSTVVTLQKDRHLKDKEDTEGSNQNGTKLEKPPM